MSPTPRRTTGIRRLDDPTATGHDIALYPNTSSETRRAAVRIADHLGTQFPHPLDQSEPTAAGRATARELAVKVGLLELLAALGLNPADLRGA